MDWIGPSRYLAPLYMASIQVPSVYHPFINGLKLLYFSFFCNSATRRCMYATCMADYISCHLSSSIHPWNPYIKVSENIYHYSEFGYHKHIFFLVKIYSTDSIFIWTSVKLAYANLTWRMRTGRKAEPGGAMGTSNRRSGAEIWGSDTLPCLRKCNRATVLVYFTLFQPFDQEYMDHEGPEKATRGGVNESQSKFLAGTWSISRK
jgi:hypothetical protein